MKIIHKEKKNGNKPSMKNLFGTWKDMPIDAQKLKDEIREEDKRHDKILFRQSD